MFRVKFLWETLLLVASYESVLHYHLCYQLWGEENNFSPCLTSQKVHYHKLGQIVESS